MIADMLNSENFKVYEIQTSEALGGYDAEDNLVSLNTFLDKKDTDNPSEWYSSSMTKKYTRFVMWKKDYTTSNAIATLARRIGVSRNRFRCAGNKDKGAETIQMCSVYGISPGQISQTNLKDIRILHAFESDKEVKMGELIGNKFEVYTSELDSKELDDKKLIDGFKKIAETGYVPNYFGRQRFGSQRENTYKIGLEILKGNFENAVEHLLTDTSDLESNPKIKEVRAFLKETHDYRKAYEIFPKYMRMEHLVLYHLKDKPTDYANALRRIPKTILLLYTHSVQSLMFNRMVYQRMKEGNLTIEDGEYYCGEKDNAKGFPDIHKKLEGQEKQKEREGRHVWLTGKVIGYETKLNEREEELLSELDLTIDDFKVRHMPEISSRGTYRTILTPVIGPKIEREIEKNNNLSKITFSLQPGSYATVVLNEALENKPFLG